MEKYSVITQTQEEYEKQIQALNSVNLEHIVEVQFNAEVMQTNFRLITEAMKKQFKLLNICSGNLDDFIQKQDNDRRLDDLKREHDELQEMLDKLLNECKRNMRMLEGMKDGVDANKNTDLIEKQKELDDRLKELEDLINRINALIDEKNRSQQKVQDDQQQDGLDTDVAQDLDRLNNLLDGLRSRANAIKDSNNKIRTQLGSSNGGNEAEYQRMLDSIKEMMDRIEKGLVDKLNCDDFDGLLMNQDSGNAATEENQSIVVGSSKDKNRLKQMDSRLKEHQAMLNEIEKKLESLKDQFNNNDIKEKEHMAQNDTKMKNLNEKQIEQMQDVKEYEERISVIENKKMDRSELGGFDKDKMRKDMMDIINKLKEAVSSNCNRLEGTGMEIDDLKRKIDQAMKKLLELEKKGKNNNDEVDTDQVQKMIDEAIKQLRDELLGLLQNIQKQLDKKMGSEDDLLIYQQKVFQKIDEIVGALVKQLANKNETKKALLYLEKKITELYLLINPEGKEKGDLGDLLSKRPLFWSCVSCDKDLDQYQGRLGDYRNWKVFPPKETAPERMGRFGVGYAQMMQNRKQNIEREKEMMKDKNNVQSGSDTNMNTRQQFNNSHSSAFPDIKEEKKYKK